MQFPSLFRRTPFRLTLLFLALFAAAASAILAYVYIASASEAQARARSDVEAENGTLTAIYRERGPDALNQALVDRILTEIGSDRHVYFLDYWQKQKGAWPKFNDALLAATARWPNLRIANWSTLAKQHPEWHGPDGAHYTGKGAKARNTYLVDTMIKAAKAAASRPRRTVRAGRPSLSGRPHVA